MRTITFMRSFKINVCQQAVVVPRVLNVFTTGSGVFSLLSKKKKKKKYCEREVTCRVSQINMELSKGGEMPQC